MRPGRERFRVGTGAKIGQSKLRKFFAPAIAFAGALALTGCAVPAPTPPAIASASNPVAPTSAALAGVSAGPAIAALGFAPEDARAALSAFVESCPQLLTRDDISGLVAPPDWHAACDAAGDWPADAARFFATHFESVRIDDGSAFATGYFEPEIAGSRTRRPGYETPVYAVPTDLVRAWPDDVPATQREGEPPLGRYDAAGDLVPYFDRAAIEAGALETRADVIAYAADPVDFFFLQIQGSGRLRTPEGDVIRIGYAGQNGRGYTAIGAIMRERGLLGDGPGQYPASMQGITAYIRDNPEQGRELMRLNQSWVFFRELVGDGPLGTLGVPVRARASVAVDPAFVPLGAPVWLDLDRDEADGLWIAQDTGGAIKGANRFDTFWGAGEKARETAGTMSSSGEALILLPLGSIDRLRMKAQMRAEAQP